jgi:hypothetical protein
MPDLMHAIKELQKHWRSIISVFGTVMTTATAKHMAERQPIFFDQNLKAFDCAVIRVEKELRECRHLACAIPSV